MIRSANAYTDFIVELACERGTPANERECTRKDQQDGVPSSEIQRMPASYQIWLDKITSYTRGGHAVQTDGTVGSAGDIDEKGTDTHRNQHLQVSGIETVLRG